MNLDARIFLAINQHSPAWVGAIAHGLSVIGSPEAALGWVVLLAAFGMKDRFRRFTYCAGTVCVALGIDFVLKHLIARPRPYHVLAMTHTIGPLASGYSFPSGHATASFALAVAVCFAWPKLKGLPLLLALAIGLSRIVVGMHYPSDVLGGAVLGAVVAIGAWSAWGKQHVPKPGGALVDTMTPRGTKAE